MGNAIRILVADDHCLVRDGIKLILQSQILPKYEVNEAGDGEQVLNWIEKEECDLLLLDLSLPIMNGLEVLQRIKDKQINIPVLVISSYNDEDRIMRAFDLGAMGYMVKNSGSSELILAINTVRKRERYYSSEVAQIILGAKTKEMARPRIEGLLSKRELEVLEYIVKGTKNKDIAPKMGISPRTVEHHRKNIRTKLEIDTTSGLVQFVLENRLFIKH